MEQNILFTALSTSILVSLIQGSIIYLLLKLLLNSFTDLSSEKRFKLVYGAMVLIFSGFIFSLILAYMVEMLKTNTILTDVPLLFEESYSKTIASRLYSNRVYTTWIAGLYFTGLIIQGVIISAGLHHIHVIRNNKNLWTDKAWGKRLHILCAKLNLPDKVSLKLADRVFSPFTAGFINPVIIFPIAMLNRLSPEQVEAILLHELAHIKRNDYLLNIIQKIIEAVLFFNPFVWLLATDLRKEREFACDDLVMEHSPDPSLYARALVHIAESTLKDYPLGIAASGNNKFNLFNRIKRLKDMKTQINNSNPGIFVLLLSIAAACLSLAWIIPADTTNAKRNNLLVIEKIKPVLFANKPAPGIPALVPVPPTPVLLPLQALHTVPAITDTNKLKKYFNSAEWKKQMKEMKAQTAEMKKHFDSPEWKKEMENMKMHAEDMKKKFDSPEWKKEMEEMKAHAAEMKKHFDNPEWKKEMEDMKIHAEDMKKKFDSPEWKKEIEDMKIHAEEIKKKFDSPEWKKQIEDLKVNADEINKKFNSPEWKKQMKDMENEVEKMNKQIKNPDKKSADTIK